MTIWTSFFLVLSLVILAYPFLAPGDGSRGGGKRPYKNSPDLHSPDTNSPWHEEEVQLDLAVGRLGPIDYEAGGYEIGDHGASGHGTGEEPAGDDPAEAPARSEEDNGSLPEGSTAQ